MEYKRSDTSSSREDSITNYKEKMPCEICRSNANDHLIMICYKLQRNTRAYKLHLPHQNNVSGDASEDPLDQQQMKRMQESREEPCEICGSVGIASLIMVCSKCRETREHTYCAKVFQQSVPPIWLCEACCSSSRVLLIPGVVAEDQMDSETNVVERSSDPKISLSSIVDDHETVKVRAINMEEVVATSVIHQPMQPHDTIPLAKETLSSNDSYQNNEKKHQQPSQAFPKKRKTFKLMGKDITL